MNIETLHHFQYIAKYKNVTKAARHFYISQSTLSRQMMALEKELGVVLFERSNKQLELTDAGEVFYKECELFIKHMETIIQKTQFANKGQSGVLRVVSPGNISPVLQKSLYHFKNDFPDTSLVIESYNFTEIPSAILYDIYDVGFTYQFAASDEEQLCRVPVGEEPFSLAVASSIVKDSSTENISGIVNTLPLLLPSYSQPPFIKLVMYELENYTNRKNIDVIYVNTTDSAMLQVSLGLGYSIVPTSMTKSKSSDTQITYIPLNEFSAKGNVVMLYNKENNSALAEEFIKLVKSYAEKPEENA